MFIVGADVRRLKIHSVCRDQNLLTSAPTILKYFQLSWKEKGKTVSRRLSSEQAAIYRQWVANRQRLESLIEKMQHVSHKAPRHLLGSEKLKKRGTKTGDIASSSA